jgi:hypothetical protein
MDYSTVTFSGNFTQQIRNCSQLMNEPGGGNDDLPWLYTQPLQHIGGC